MYERTFTCSIPTNQHIRFWTKRRSIILETFEILDLNISNFHSVQLKNKTISI